MKSIKALLLLAGLLTLSAPASAVVDVFACEPEWASLAREIGGDDVRVFSATTAFQDPHRIEARPSLIAKLRRADLLVCTGAELEIGWLPMLLRQAGNAHVQPGKPGYLEAAAQVERLEIPSSVDRSMGDVHASGNPHIHLDPRRIATVATVMEERLKRIAPEQAQAFSRRAEDFRSRWSAAIDNWESRAAPLKGTRAVVYHKDWVYLFDWLGMKEAGSLEPKPGLPPTPGHLASLKAELATTPAAMIIRAPYQSDRASRWLSSQTDIPAVTLPYTVGGSEEADDLFGLFDETLTRLLEAAE